MKHVKQIQCFNDPSRFKFILAGRRGGKTHLIVEDIVKTVFSAPSFCDIVYIGPSNQQAKELIWEPLVDRFTQLGWGFEDYISKQRIELSNRRYIYVLGAEKIRRIRGHKLAKAYLDELAFFTDDLGKIWRAIRPALSDLKGGAIVSTTPDGKGTQAYDFYLQAIKGNEWKYFHWKTVDNPYIDKSEIEDAKRELDEKSFLQEYEAEWTSFEALAYYNFSENVHIKATGKINEHLPINIALDFNVNPTSLLVSQHISGVQRYYKEYSFKNSSTEETIKAFCDDYSTRKGQLIRIRGDASGAARKSNTGRTDYDYTHQILKHNGFTFVHEVMAANPAIVDRVKIVNGWLKPMVGSPKVEIDPSCQELIRDLSSQELDGRIPSARNNRGHKADAFGYDIYWEHIDASRRPQRTIRL